MAESEAESACERYLRLRLDNPELGTREAARLAGFVHGVPSARARRLLAKALELRGRCAEMRAMLERNLASHQRNAREMAEWLCALEAVEV